MMVRMTTPLTTMMMDMVMIRYDNDLVGGAHDDLRARRAAIR